MDGATKQLTPHYQHGGVSIYQGDCLEILPQLPEKSVHCCVTSPPYWGLRDYGVDGQIGLEATLDDFVAKMVEVFRGVWRVLRDDGVLWLNLGDSYAGTGSGSRDVERWPKQSRNDHKPPRATTLRAKQKDLLGVPWHVAFALQTDGWYLRSDVIWAKNNPMPESVTDRPTKAHEYLFLLTKKPKYFYDAEAVREEGMKTANRATFRGGGQYVNNHSFQNAAVAAPNDTGQAGVPSGSRNLRDVWSLSRDDWMALYDQMEQFGDVWTIPTKSYSGAHFATFPPKLIEPCIKAGTSEEGCCPECGAPWERVTEKKRVRTRPGKNSKAYDRTTGEIIDDGMEKPWRDKAEIGNRDPGRHVTSTKTIDWEPTCKCNAGDPVPCTVLDIFLGSGTTAEVARQNGCRSIGVELSEEYIKLAAKRLQEGWLF